MTTLEAITATKAKINEQLDFLPKYTGKHYLAYETMIYEYMGYASPDYKGGLWSYYGLSNGGFYMRFIGREVMNMECEDNMYQGEMSADAASIGINLFVQNAFAWQVDAERFSAAYHALRDFALQHKEAGEILRFID